MPRGIYQRTKKRRKPVHRTKRPVYGRASTDYSKPCIHEQMKAEAGELRTELAAQPPTIDEVVGRKVASRITEELDEILHAVQGELLAANGLLSNLLANVASHDPQIFAAARLLDSAIDRLAASNDANGRER